MSNPFLIQVPFAVSGSKNTIQITRQPTQDEEDATYNSGFPPVTMVKEELGGKPPKGLDFNGIFYELSSPIVHYCKGGRIYFDQTYADAIGGYPQGHLLTSDDNLKDYLSLVPNNTVNPNTGNITGFWKVYAGEGSIPNATSTITGTVKIANTLTSTAVDTALTAAQGKVLQDTKLAKTDLVNNLTTNDATKALTAAQGKVLNDKMLGVSQTWQNVARNPNTNYTNSTGRPIQVSISLADTFDQTATVSVLVGGVTIMSITYDSGNGYGASCYSFIVPNGTTYRVNLTAGTITNWSELR